MRKTWDSVQRVLRADIAWDKKFDDLQPLWWRYASDGRTIVYTGFEAGKPFQQRRLVMASRGAR